MVWLVGCGASLGACVRYLLTNLINHYKRGAFPYATLFLNLSGAFLLGFIIGKRVGTMQAVFFGTGFMGGYTTFSTFNTELFALIHDHRLMMAFLYGIISYGIGIGLAFLGWMLGNHLAG